MNKIRVNGVEFVLPEGVELTYCRTPPNDDPKDYMGVPRMAETTPIEHFIATLEES
jgi:hypothetical protein